MKEEIAKSRPESRPRPAFFGIHVRTSKSTRTFEFRTNSVSVSPRSFLKRSRSSSFAIEANTHPAPTAHPPKISGIVCSVEILGPCAHHMCG
ncbi:MAG: hypothetical protein ACK53Y_03010 [bacterium]